MTQPGTAVELSKKTIEMFAQMAGALEQYETGGSDNIIQRILAANTVEDYNAIFAGDRGLPLNVQLEVTRVRYAPSEFPGGLPFYLVVDAINRRTGEAKEYTVGAESVVAMLVRAAFKDQLPCIGYALEAEKLTKAGTKPINWTFVSVTDNSPKANQ